MAIGCKNEKCKGKKGYCIHVIIKGVVSGLILGAVLIFLTR